MTSPPSDHRAALAAACDPQSPPSLLRSLAHRREPEVLDAIAANPNTPRELLLSLVAGHQDAFLSNPALEFLEIEMPGCFHAIDGHGALLLASRPTAPAWLRNRLLASPKVPRDRVLQMAASPTTPPAVLAALAGVGNMVVRCWAARNPALPGEVLVQLAGDANHEVRAAVARATSDPALLDRLGHDPHPSPRLFARSRSQRPPASAPPPAATLGGGHATLGQRSHQEDAFVAAPFPGAFLALVADGMGGHSSGAVASELVAREMPRVIGELLPFASIEEEMGCLGAAVDAAQEGVCGLSKELQHTGIGTTVAALLLCEDRAHLAHVGDSRIYRLRAGHLEQMTQDHSLLNEYLKVKALTPQEIADFPHKNVITRALGMTPESVVSDRITVSIEPGDCFLVCSDGLFAALADPQMIAILEAHAGDAVRAARALAEAAEAAQGKDNISAVVVDTRPAPGHPYRVTH